MPTYFAVLVDNEVALNVIYGDEPIFEKHIAIARSGPILIEVPAPVTEGAIWDGTNFTDPS